MKLEDLTPGTCVRGILTDATVSVVSVQWHSLYAVTLVYRDPCGRVANEIPYRYGDPASRPSSRARRGAFDGDGALFRLVVLPASGRPRTRRARIGTFTASLATSTPGRRLTANLRNRSGTPERLEQEATS